MESNENMTAGEPVQDNSASSGEQGCGLLGSGRSRIWRGAVIVAAVVAVAGLAAHSMLMGSACGKGGCGGCGGGWGASSSTCPLEKQYGPHRYRGGLEAVSGGATGSGSSYSSASKDGCCPLVKDCCGEQTGVRNSGGCPMVSAPGLNCPNNPGGGIKGPCPMAGGVQK